MLAELLHNGMTCNSTGSYSYTSGIGCSSAVSKCADEYGCYPNVCPDFLIRRHDNKPAFKVKVQDCDCPLDLTDLVVEATMWAKARLKVALDLDDTVIGLADNIGFNQLMVGDVIMMDQARLPEKMLVVGFDEQNRVFEVQRGYHGTPVQKWRKGASLRIIKFSNAPGSTEMVYHDVIEIDGCVTNNVLLDSYIVYEFSANDTCLPGCYYLEFKLMKLVTLEASLAQSDIPDGLLPSGIVPSFTPASYTPSNFACGISPSIEWIRRFPLEGEGFLIKIVDSPTIDD